ILAPQAVHERDVSMVEDVVDVGEDVAIPNAADVHQQLNWRLVLWIAREVGRLAFTQEGEDQAQVFPDRVATDLDPLTERVWLGRRQGPRIERSVARTGAGSGPPVCPARCAAYRADRRAVHQVRPCR